MGPKEHCSDEVDFFCVPILGEIFCVCDRFFLNPTIEIATFCLYGWSWFENMWHSYDTHLLLHAWEIFLFQTFSSVLIALHQISVIHQFCYLIHTAVYLCTCHIYDTVYEARAHPVDLCQSVVLPLCWLNVCPQYVCVYIYYSVESNIHVLMHVCLCIKAFPRAHVEPWESFPYQTFSSMLRAFASDFSYSSISLFNSYCCLPVYVPYLWHCKSCWSVNVSGTPLVLDCYSLSSECLNTLLVESNIHVVRHVCLCMYYVSILKHTCNYILCF